MSTADLLGTPPERTTTPQPDDTARRRLLRAAGLGGVGAFAAWLAQPVLVVVLAASDAPEVPAWADVEANSYNGAIELVIFTLIGIGVLTMVLATWDLLRARTTPSVVARVGVAMGLVGAVAWFWVAADSFSMFTSVGAGLPDVTSDVDLQRAVIDRTYLDVMAGVLLTQIGLTGFATMMATAGRRAGLIGRPTAILLAVVVLVPLYQLAVPFAPPFPLFAGMLGMLVLGAGFLVKSRR